jgi:hypothetical protein
MNNRDRKRTKIHKIYQPHHLKCELWGVPTIISNNIDQYEDSRFTGLKTMLNKSKSSMDDIYLRGKSDPALARSWTAVQSAVDLYRFMRKSVSDKTNAQSVTNAWLKYYEIIREHNLIKTGQVKAFFNAELPGAALCALNHYVKTMKTGDFDWRASSLYTTNLGDSYGLYENNLDKWLMDVKHNGDMTVVENVLLVEKRIKNEFGLVDFYSHDAGIDVSTYNNGELGFNNQETINSQIHFGCALAGLITLDKGGCFIAKQYTCFETFTWNAILIYASLFDNFYVCKPLTSRPYNSEIYLVGKGFRGLPENIREILFDRLSNFSMKPLIPKELVDGELAEQRDLLLNFATKVYTDQIIFIEENLNLFEKYSSNVTLLNKGLEYIRHERKNNWLKTYPVKSIDSALWLSSRTGNVIRGNDNPRANYEEFSNTSI